MFIIPIAIGCLIFLFIIILITQIIIPLQCEDMEYFWLFKKHYWIKKSEYKNLTPKEQLKLAIKEFENAEKILKEVMKNVESDKEEASNIIKEAKVVEKQGKSLLNKLK